MWSDRRVVRLDFDGGFFDEGFRVDLVVEAAVVVELKSAEKMSPVYVKQLLSDVRLMDLRLGLPINCGAPAIRDGIQRIVNGLESDDGSLAEL